MESEAPPSAGFYNFLGWVDVNKKRIAVGVVVLAVVGSIAALLIWRQGQREIEAAQALSSVRAPASPNQPPSPGTAEAYLKIATEYPKTAAGAQALLNAGSLFFAEGNWARAQEQFENFVRNHAETGWAPQAVYGIAACLEAQGKTQEAMAKFNDYLKSYPSDAGADLARLSLARLYAGSSQPQQAIQILDKMAKEAQFTPAGNEAQEQLRELYAKHPELVPPPPVPQASTPMMLPPNGAPVPLAPAPGSEPNAAAPGVPQINLQPPPTPGQ